MADAEERTSVPVVSTTYVGDAIVPRVNSISLRDSSRSVKTIHCAVRGSHFSFHSNPLIPMPKHAKRRGTSERLIRRDVLAKEISRIIDDRAITQTEAGYITREAPSQVSLIVTGKLDGFSPERLLRILTAFGRDVEIRITRSKTKSGKVRVRFH